MGVILEQDFPSRGEFLETHFCVPQSLAGRNLSPMDTSFD